MNESFIIRHVSFALDSNWILRGGGGELKIGGGTKPVGLENLSHIPWIDYRALFFLIGSEVPNWRSILQKEPIKKEDSSSLLKLPDCAFSTRYTLICALTELIQVQSDRKLSPASHAPVTSTKRDFTAFGIIGFEKSWNRNAITGKQNRKW